MPSRSCLDAIIDSICELPEPWTIPFDLSDLIRQEALIVIERESLTYETHADCKKLRRVVVPIGYDIIRRSRE